MLSFAISAFIGGIVVWIYASQLTNLIFVILTLMFIVGKIMRLWIDWIDLNKI